MSEERKIYECDSCHNPTANITHKCDLCLNENENIIQMQKSRVSELEEKLSLYEWKDIKDGIIRDLPPPRYYSSKGGVRWNKSPLEK